MTRPILSNQFISTASGTLELLLSLPSNASASPKTPLLCLHGAHCSASDFQLLLPRLAAAGHPSYAVSLRGHGKSWSGSFITHHILTSISSYVSDVISALEFIEAEHPDIPPVLIGHSFGGGILQHALSKRKDLTRRIAGLILLVSAPLSGGGMDIQRNWQGADDALKSQLKAEGKKLEPLDPSSLAEMSWMQWLWSFIQIPNGLETPLQVRTKFFSAETSDKIVHLWMRTCPSRFESLRAAMAIYSQLGEAKPVLDALLGLKDGRRKVLCVAADKDVLVPVDMVKRNAEAYWNASRGDGAGQETETALFRIVADSGHQLMMDVGLDECAESILRWISGDDL